MDCKQHFEDPFQRRLKRGLSIGLKLWIATAVRVMPLVGLAVLYADSVSSTGCLETKQQGTALCRLLLQVQRRIARYSNLEGIATAQPGGGRPELTVSIAYEPTTRRVVTRG
jgi:hypothetical protein